MKRGRCPSLASPMLAADGLLLRVRPRHGRLDAGAARMVAAGAKDHGNGAIELTSRGKLQLRGFSAASARRFAVLIEEAGLAAPPGQDMVLASPLLGADPSLHPETETLANTIGSHLAALSFTGPREKFLVTVDGGGTAGLAGPRADLALRAEGAGWHLLIDGGGQATFRSGGAALAAVLALIDRLHACRETGIHRMRELVVAPGAESLPALDRLQTVAMPRRPGFDAGFLRCAGKSGAFGLGIPFGEMTAETLLRLVELALYFGDGMLRLAPQRIVLMAGVAAAAAPTLARAAEPLITSPADPRLRIAACIGRPRCAAATTATRADAERLAALGLGEGLHLSGCPKGCAHPAPAPATLVGRNGRYDLVLNGRASDTPAHAGLNLAEAALLVREMGEAVA
ncbi:MAG TPA: precorrin-3B synthase [Acetobacteraceae bacterium]|nr:precorrin-3B synthase [Acetobacteraceae bacterium]